MKRVLRGVCSCYLLGSAAHTQRLLRRLSGGWLFLYGGVLLFGVFFWSGGWGDFFRLAYSKPLVLLPVCYFGFCWCTSYARRRSWGLLLTGTFAHGLLAVFVVQNASYSVLGPVFILAGLYIAVVWFWMYSKLEASRPARCPAVARGEAQP